MALSVLGRHDEALQCAQATLAQFVASGDQRSAGKIELNLARCCSGRTATPIRAATTAARRSASPLCRMSSSRCWPTSAWPTR